MMWTHERAQFGSMMIWRHEQIALIFVGRIAGSWLSGCGQALEVKLICISFAMNFGHYVFVVVISGMRKIVDFFLDTYDVVGHGLRYI